MTPCVIVMSLVEWTGFALVLNREWAARMLKLV